MKRFISIFIVFISLTVVSGCDIFKWNESYRKNAFGVFKAEGITNQSVHLLLYFPGEGDKYLIPEERLVKVERFIEQTITEEIIKGPKAGKGEWELRNVKLLSVKGKGDTVTLDFSKQLVDVLKLNSGKERLLVYSIVNSLTELPGVKGVLFKSEGRNLDRIGNIDFSRALKRDRSLFNRDISMKPNEALRREMTFEKNGEWLKSYLLMSDDENNPHRKYYEFYIQEMQEMKSNGFLNTNFKVGSYKIDPSGKKARVEVSFLPAKADKTNAAADKVYFNLVKIDGVWMVDWLTKQ